MAWLKSMEAAGVPGPDSNAIFPFEKGKAYWQLDLDGRDAVEGVAQHYLNGETAGYFSNKIVNEIEAARNRDIGSVAVYTLLDKFGCEIAYVYASEGTAFVGSQE